MVTPQNFVSLSYGAGGMDGSQSLVLKASGMAHAEAQSWRWPPVHQKAVKKLNPAQFAAILRLVNASDFPALKARYSKRGLFDGETDEVGLIYRDRAGHRHECHVWAHGDRPAAFAQLCSSLAELVNMEVGGLAMNRPEPSYPPPVGKRP